MKLNNGRQLNGKKTQGTVTLLMTLPKSSVEFFILSYLRERQPINNFFVEQGGRRVTEHIIDLYAIATESRLNEEALTDAFYSRSE